MCMEDIKIGRRTVSHTVSSLIANNNGLVVPANGRRVGLFFDGGLTPNTTVVRDIFTTAITNDIINQNRFLTLLTANPFYLMRIEEWGVAVQLGYTMFQQSGGPMAISFTEMILLE